jgi:hypothetical protein
VFWSLIPVSLNDLEAPSAVTEEFSKSKSSHLNNYLKTKENLWWNPHQMTNHAAFRNLLTWPQAIFSFLKALTAFSKFGIIVKSFQRSSLKYFLSQENIVQKLKINSCPTESVLTQFHRTWNAIYSIIWCDCLFYWEMFSGLIHIYNIN